MDSLYNYLFGKTKVELLEEKLNELEAQYKECDRLTGPAKIKRGRELAIESDKLMSSIDDFTRMNRETEEDKLLKKNN